MPQHPSLKDRILDEIGNNYFRIYSHWVDGLNPTREQNDGLRCPLHDDSVGSLSVHLGKGVWKCFGGCQAGGDIFAFYMLKEGIPASRFPEALEGIGKILGIEKEVGQKYDNHLQGMDEQVLRVHTALKDSDTHLAYLKDKRGITFDIIEKLEIGYNALEGRTWFPVRDKTGRLLNVRKHKEGAHKDKVTGIRKNNSAKIYPQQLLTGEGPIYLFAGEMDTCHALSLGITNSVCHGLGETTWNSGLNIWFKDRDVIICFDYDDAGHKGAVSIANALLTGCTSVKIIALPVEGKGEDFTDYILQGGTADAFYALCTSTPVYGKPTRADKKGPPEPLDDVDLTTHHDYGDEVIQCTLEDSSRKDHYFKDVSFRAMCIGKDYTPFLVPRKVIIKCTKNAGEACKTCHLFSRNMEGPDDGFKITFDNYTMLKMADVNKREQEQILGQIVRAKCKAYWRAIVKAAENIEEIILSPEISFSKDRHEDTIRLAYFLGQGISTNTLYEISGTTVPHPKNQHATQIVKVADNTDSDIDGFKMDDETLKLLSIFKAHDSDDMNSIERRYMDIYSDLSVNVFRIYGREKLFCVLIMTWFSLIDFSFQDENIKKCHVESLILGDPRTGKSKMAEKLMEHLRAGKIVNCERATIPGLVGGAVNISGSRQVLQWGTIPQNDRRLVILDEITGLDEETIGNLSGIRSSCIASRTIAGGTRETRASTRLVWLSNPRHTATVREHNTGVEAIQKLIGAPEDTARFDIATIVSENDVDIDLMSSGGDKAKEHVYTSDLFNKLILWAWSRTNDDVVFGKKTTKAIIESSKRLSSKYTAKFPLVHPAEQRIKIAKLTAAVAASQFSTDETGEKVIITEGHVQFVEAFLQLIYDDQSFGYDIYSRMHKTESKFTSSTETRINNLINPYGKTFVKHMLMWGTFNKQDIQMAIGGLPSDAMDVSSKLLDLGAIQRRGSFFVKTEAFRNILRTMSQEVFTDDGE